MNEDRDIVLFRVDRGVGLLLLAALVVAFGGFALAQQLTLTTSYPVPAGIYNQLTTTGSWGSVPTDTTFNRNAGNTILVPPTNASGSVGIGTLTPTSMLSVAGGVQLGNDVAACTTAKAGTLIWASGGIQYCNGSVWGPLLGAAQAVAPPTLTYVNVGDYFQGAYYSSGYWLMTAGAGATTFGYSEAGIHRVSPTMGWQGGGIATSFDNVWFLAEGPIDGAYVVQDGVTYTW